MYSRDVLLVPTFMALVGQVAAFPGMMGVPAANADDPRFLNWVPAGPGDSRGPCPGLNSLANHGFLPHDGKDISLADLIVACYEGLGTSPETSGFLGVCGIASSNQPLTTKIKLEDLSRHDFSIEHDCSFSREDGKVGNNNNFSPAMWDTSLNQLNQSEIVGVDSIGRAKGARIRQEIKLNPSTEFAGIGLAFGQVEHGLVLTALQTSSEKSRLEYFRTLFEEERLPYKEGWRRTPFATNFPAVLAVGAKSFFSLGLESTVIGLLQSPTAVLKAITPGGLTTTVVQELSDIIVELGFPKPDLSFIPAAP